MIDLSQKVYIILASNNMEYYKNKGYDIDSLRVKISKNRYQIPRNTKILVILKDVSLGSSVSVNYTCDYCGELFQIEYCVYNVHREKSSLKKDACSKCSGHKRAESKLLKDKLEGIDHISLIAKEFDERNLLLVSKVYISCHKKLQYICLNHSELGIKEIAYTQFKLGQGCKQCGIESRVQKQSLHINNEELKKQFDLRGYDLISKEDLNGSKQKLQYICRKHKDKGILKISYYKFDDGQGCKYCGFEATADSCRLDYNYIFDEFAKKDLTLLSEKYVNNVQNLLYICNKHRNNIQDISYANFQQGEGCYYCSLERRSGENHHNWHGGVSEIGVYLRDKLKQWKKDSMQSSKFKCIITNKRFDIIHHLHGFDQILQEVFQETQININQHIIDYTQEELEVLSQKCIELHNKYPLGVCLTTDIHKLFHLEYSYGQNTPQQFTEFQQRYNNGEFTSLLSAK